MASRIWSREDIRNILLAIYAAKLRPSSEAWEETSTIEDAATAACRLHQWGCRAAVQSLMLAFGLPLQLLDQAINHPVATGQATKTSTEHWWLEDLENVIAAVYRSAISAPVVDSSPTDTDFYRQGFSEVIAAVLHAIGSRKDTLRWLEQALADRYWIFLPDQDTARPIGSAPDETEPE